MKNNNKIVHYLLLTLIFGVGFFTLLAHTLLHAYFHDHNVMKPAPITFRCTVKATPHEIDIQNNKFTPHAITIKQCDTVTFKNIDQHSLYLPAFGDHPSHFAYPGFEEKVLGYGQENTFVVTLKGTYSFHDHLKDTAEGQLTIN